MKSKINLHSCKRGQKLRTKDGRIATYDYSSSQSGRHVVQLDNRATYYDNNGEAASSLNNGDIVEVLPLYRTDENIVVYYDSVTGERCEVVPVSFARELEDEIAQLKNERAAFVTTVDAMIAAVDKHNTNISNIANRNT